MKQKLELEIQQLNVSLGLLKDLENEELRKKVDALQMNLRDKEESLEELEELSQKLIIKERKSSDELQYARKILINVSVCFPLKFTHLLNQLLFQYVTIED